MQVRDLIAEIRKEEAESNAAVQFVLTSRRWSNALEELIMSITHPEVIMTSGLEILVYSQLAPSIHAATPDTRDALVLDLLRDKHCKSIVCCSTAEEAEHLGSFLTSSGLKNVLLAAKQDESAVIGLFAFLIKALLIFNIYRCKK